MTTSRSELRLRHELDLFLGTGQWAEGDSDREGQRCATQIHPPPGQTLRAYFSAGGGLVAMAVTQIDGSTVEVPAAVLVELVAKMQASPAPTPGAPKRFTWRR